MPPFSSFLVFLKHEIDHIETRKITVLGFEPTTSLNESYYLFKYNFSFQTLQLQLWTNILAIYIRIQLLAFHYLREPKPGINQMTFGTMVVELWTRDRKAM